MDVVFADLETFWSQTHSLTKMNPIVYALHPETEIQSISVRKNKGKSHVLFGEKTIQKWARSVDWSKTMLVGHNMSGFDAMILKWRLGINPKMWGCTMAMARPFFAKTCGLSLKALAEHMQLARQKGSLMAVGTKGKKLKEFTPDEISKMRVYNKDDTDICADIFYELVRRTGKRELKLIDMTIRMLVDSVFEADIPLIEKTLKEVKETKRQNLKEIAKVIVPKEVSHLMDEEELIESARANLASAPKFKKLLQGLGVEIPMKTSPTTGKQIPALAKSDEGLQELLESGNLLVAQAVEARLGVKSTILETRLESIAEIARYTGGIVPIPLSYAGADTTRRWSGMMKINAQNLPRVNPKEPKPSDALRKCLRAPKGYKVVVADLSGIELRVNHFLWKVERSMELFKNDPDGADLYKDFASATLYHKPFEDIDKDERQMGKVSQLGLGFGSGPPTFIKVAKSLGGISLDLKQSQEIVYAWRDTYPEIVNGWKRCQKAVTHIYNDNEGVPIDPWGLCHTMKGGIKTPKGEILYPDLRQELDDEDRMQFVYGNGRKKARIYGPKVVENIVQHLAREVMADMMLKIKKYYPIRHTVHDEIILVVKEDKAEEALDFMLSVMKAGVDWWPELITSGEGDIADCYGDAK